MVTEHQAHGPPESNPNIGKRITFDNSGGLSLELGPSLEPLCAVIAFSFQIITLNILIDYLIDFRVGLYRFYRGCSIEQEIDIVDCRDAPVVTHYTVSDDPSAADR